MCMFLEWICVINEAFWLYVLADTLYERRNEEVQNDGYRRRLGGFVLCFTVLVRVLSRVTDTFPYMVSVMVLCAIFLLLSWRCSALDAFAFSGGYLLLYEMAGSVGLRVAGISTKGDQAGRWLADITPGGKEEILFRSVEFVLWFLLASLYFKWLTRNRRQGGAHPTVPGGHTVIVFAGVGGTAFFVVLFLLNMVDDLIRARDVGWYFFFVLLIMLILWGYFQMEHIQMRDQMHTLDMQNDILASSYERANSFYVENAKLYHDMNHHLDVIRQMIRKGDGKRAEDYIVSLREPLDGSRIPDRAGMDVVDVVLYEAEQRAGRSGLKIEFRVQTFPQDMEMDRKDLCALFSNLLDNALESAEREIRLTAKINRGMLFILCENDYSVIPVEGEGGFLTGKADKGHHGWGTRIIRQIVEKYDGSIRYDAGEQFRVEIMVGIGTAAGKAIKEGKQ